MNANQKKQRSQKLENSKQVQETLTRVLSSTIPQMAPEEFQRIFNIRVTPDELQDISFMELMIRQLVLKACAGNDKSIQEILDRLIGKPVQTVEAFQENVTYHDFLLQCYEQDEAKRLSVQEPRQVVDCSSSSDAAMEPEPQAPADSVQDPTVAPTADPIDDLL